MNCSVCGAELQEEDRVAVYGPKKFGGDGVWCEMCCARHNRPVTAMVTMTEFEGKPALGYQSIESGLTSSFNEWIARHYQWYGQAEEKAKEASA